MDVRSFGRRGVCHHTRVDVGLTDYVVRLERGLVVCSDVSGGRCDSGHLGVDDAHIDEVDGADIGCDERVGDRVTGVGKAVTVGIAHDLF